MGIIYNSKSVVTDKLSLYVDSQNKKSFDNSQIIKSVAPNTWTAITNVEETSWSGICYGNGRWVATAIEGTNRVAYSDDGINWTAASASEAHQWYDVAYGNGKFVAVGSIYSPFSTDVDRVMTSSDGINWVTRNATHPHAWQSVTYGNGYFVACSTGPTSGSSNNTKRIMYSTEGISWTEGPTVSANDWQDIQYGDGKFVAVASTGASRVMYASEDDLTSWSYATAAESNYWMKIAYGNGKWVAVSYDGTNRVMHSTNVTSWSSASAVSAVLWYGLTYGNGYFVACAASGGAGFTRIMYSTDGSSWTEASSAIGTEPWRQVGYGNGKFVAIQVSDSPGTSDTQFMYNSEGFTYPTLNDISGKGSTTTLHSDFPVSQYGSGSPGSPILFGFNGTTDYAEFLSNSNIAFDADFTVEIWVKFDNLSSDRPVWDTRSGTSSNDGFLIYVNSSGGLYMKTGSSHTIANSSAGIVINTWYHIAVSRIGGTVTQYLNAVQSGGQAVGTVTNYSNDDLYIGKDVSATDKLDGRIASIKAYKGKGLTTEEVKRNFNSFKGRFGL